MSRWSSLLKPASAAPPLPDLREAFGAWLLGTLWTAGCVWLALRSGPVVLPGLLLLGVLAVWGWRYMEWLGWFPALLVTAAVLERWVPFEAHVGPEAFRLTALLALGLTVITVSRAIVLRRRLTPGTPVDLLVFAFAALASVTLTLGVGPAVAEGGMQTLLIALVTFYAATTVASRPGGALKIWPVFPLIAAGLGTHLLLRSVGAYPAGDPSQEAALQATLLLALPISIGLAVDAGRASARRAWRVAVLLGTGGVALAAARGLVQGGPALWERPVDPLGAARVLACLAALFLLAVVAMRVRRSRPGERVRWLASGLTFAGAAVLGMAGTTLESPAAVTLLASACGLTAGAYRVERVRERAARAAAAVPVQEAA